MILFVDYCVAGMIVGLFSGFFSGVFLGTLRSKYVSGWLIDRLESIRLKRAEKRETEDRRRFAEEAERTGAEYVERRHIVTDRNGNRYCVQCFREQRMERLLPSGGFLLCPHCGEEEPVTHGYYHY